MILKTAVIIAGGKGTRLEEKTEDMPKPLIKIKGIPLIERIVLWLKKNGVENIVIGVAYKKEKVKEYLGDGSKLGVKIYYTEHDENGGTEDAFKLAVEKASTLSDNFYAMNGDQITDLQLEGLTNSYLRTGALAMIVTIKLRTNFGMIEIDNKSRIIGFREKGNVPNVLMNSGIYVFNKKIRAYLNKGNIEENAFRKLARDRKLFSFYYDGSWFTINDKKQLKKAEEYLK